MMTKVSSIDWDGFDPDSKDFKGIARHLHAHSRMRGPIEKSWLVPGFLAHGEMSVIFGPPSAGKSSLATDIACRLAAGVHWDGARDGWKHNVIYIAAERSSQVRRRADAFFLEHGLAKEDGLIIYDGPIDLSQRSDHLTAIIKAAAFIPDPDGWEEIHFVVIDTLSAAMSAPDSSTEATAAVADNIRRAQRETGAHVCVITHPPISDPTRARGGHITGAADTTIRVSKKLGVVTAQVEKNNDTPERPALHYTFKSVTLGEPIDGIETTAGVVVPCDSPKAANSNRPAVPTATRKALETLRKAIATNGGPVTEEQWRGAVYAAAGDIKEAAKRQRYNRAKTSVADYITENKGLFSILEVVTNRDKA